MSTATYLLDPAFMRDLEAMRRSMRVRARSGVAGERAAARRGSSAEFLEHRPYVSGDDLRRMDWLAFARTGGPVLKQFRAEEDAVVRLLIDTSASLSLGQPSKLLVAKRIAAAIGYLALASHERAQLLTTRAETVRACAPLRGRGSIATLLREIDAIVPERRTSVARAIDDVVSQSSRPGVLVAISDFLDVGLFEAAAARAVAARHELVLVQVLATEELDPPWSGDLALEDAETGALVELSVDARAIEAYLTRLDGLYAALRSTAKKCRAAYIRLRTTDPLIGVLRRVMGRTVD